MTDNPDETQSVVEAEAPQPTRDATSGRFLTGNPGGGRVKGSRNQITKLRLEQEEALRLLLRSKAEDILQRAIDMAMGGSEAVMRSLLDKMLTTPKDDPDADKKPEAVKVIVVTQPSAEPAKITVVKAKPPIDVTPTEVK